MTCRLYPRILIAAILCLAHTGAAQQRNNELGFLLGGEVNSPVDISGTSASLDRDTGLAYQVTYAHRLAGSTTGVWFEAPFVAVPLVKLSSSRGPGPIPTDYAALFITPGIRIQFHGDGKVSPWLSAGGGYALFQTSDFLTDGTANPKIYTHRGTAQFGGGVDFKTPWKILFPVKLRAQVRDFLSGKPNYHVKTDSGLQNNISISGGFVLEF